MYTLCSKDVCTTAHILGAFKVLLQQGKNTFKHNNVSHKITANTKNFVLSIKKTVPSFSRSSIKIVENEAKVLYKRTPPVGTLHHGSDWDTLVDLNSNNWFPAHITFTQVRPDITIFFRRLRKVILIELTCSCEENMESWHGVKFNKY